MKKIVQEVAIEHAESVIHSFGTRGVPNGIFDIKEMIADAFIAGAKWMKGQTKTSTSKRRMCLIDKNKPCNLCHECDIDISNPSY